MVISVALPATPATQAPSPDVNSNLSSLSSSPHQYPTDLSDAIVEEGDESESEPPNEPVTPISGRQSREFHRTLLHHDTQSCNLANDAFVGAKQPLILNNSATPPETRSPALSSLSAVAVGPSQTQPDTRPTQRPRRSTRGSAGNLTRTISCIFRRDKHNGLIEASSDLISGAAPQRKATRRRWSNKSCATTRSNSPPSPGSPSEMDGKLDGQVSRPTIPDAQLFNKKNRTSTGLQLGRRVNFLGGGHSAHNTLHNTLVARRRASSFDPSLPEQPLTGKTDEFQQPRHVWGLPPEEGIGVKARRMSLSLPDDFTVDVGDLLSEYEYQHKLLGRHGKHIGKGATSKVTLMVRKGCSGELYAVKEFRGRMRDDTVNEYEKKIKSEYTLAKSLHHPNVIETIRLCTDKGRWNHVMEYCQEGDLFSLVGKGYLKTPDREKDRQCLFKQLLQGVNYLHSNGIAHRDIKLENLLMTSGSRLKITDFGVSEVFCGIHPGLREAGGQCGVNMDGATRLSSPGICGSLPYIAPEVLGKEKPYDPRGLDVWSSAIVMIHLLFGGALWGKAMPDNAWYSALKQGWDECNTRANTLDVSEKDFPRVGPFEQIVKPPALKRVLLQMLNPDPSRRLTMAQVTNNRWVKNIECCQMESYEESSDKFDASKKDHLDLLSQRKVFCHNHLPPSHQFSSHSLGKMPGQVGY